jgi:hypothetical protein
MELPSATVSELMMFIVFPEVLTNHDSLSKLVDNYSPEFTFHEVNSAYVNINPPPCEFELVIREVRNCKGGDSLYVPVNIIKNCSRAFSSLLSTFLAQPLGL